MCGKLGLLGCFGTPVHVNILCFRLYFFQQVLVTEMNDGVVKWQTEQHNGKVRDALKHQIDPVYLGMQEMVFRGKARGVTRYNNSIPIWD